MKKNTKIFTFQTNKFINKQGLRKIIYLSFIFSIFLLTGCDKRKDNTSNGDSGPCGNFINITYDAKNNKNPKICDKISEKSCLVGCIYDTALSSHDEKICEQIDNVQLKSSCYLNLAPVKGVQLCDHLSVAEDATYNCLSIFSHSTSIPLSEGGSICTTLNMREKCIIKVGSCECPIKNGVCDLLSNKKAKDICLLKSAYPQTDSFDCDKLNFPESKKLCNSAKKQKVWFTEFNTSENMEGKCGNTTCDIHETPENCPQDCKK